jgi:predicted SAM-dependent methyltransferase
MTFRNIAKRGVSTAARSAAPLLWSRVRRQPDLRIIIGAGTHRRDGWISTDILPRAPSTLYLDVTHRFPLPDESVTAYHCEHMIEHIRYEAALHMLGEIRRTLKPGGTLRLSTPDLAKICGLIAKPDLRYVVAANSAWEKRRRPRATSPFVGASENPAFVVNRAFREWNHAFLWDARTLGEALESVGLIWHHASQSEHEHHGRTIDPYINAWETLVIQAWKPESEEARLVA